MHHLGGRPSADQPARNGCPTARSPGQRARPGGTIHSAIVASSPRPGGQRRSAQAVEGGTANAPLPLPATNWRPGHRTPKWTAIHSSISPYRALRPHGRRRSAPALRRVCLTHPAGGSGGPLAPRFSAGCLTGTSLRSPAMSQSNRTTAPDLHSSILTLRNDGSTWPIIAANVLICRDPRPLGGASIRRVRARTESGARSVDLRITRCRANVRATGCFPS